MNKQRRNELEKVSDLLREAYDLLDSAKGDEEDAFYCMPDGLKESERGEQMQENIMNLEEALSSITDAIEAVDDAIGG